MKAAIIIMAVGLLSVAGIKQFQARQQQAPVAASAPMADNATELVYFTFGMRCPTCVRMEQWSREAAAELNIPFRVDEASAETVERYGLTTKTLILRSLADGEEKDWRNLNRIWELSRDENAFKQYVKNELTAKP